MTVFVTQGPEFWLCWFSNCLTFETILYLRSSLRTFYGRYGDLTKQYEVPLSRMLHDILDDDHLQWHPPLIRHYINFCPYYWSGPYYRIWLFTLLREVSTEHLRRVRHANRGRLLLRTPGPVPLWDLQMFWCWDQSLLNLSPVGTRGL